MPQSSDRSLNGIISYLVSRIILKEPPTFSKPSAPAFKESQREEEDDEDDEHGYEEWNDDIFGIGGGAQQSLAM